jgi:hypothetical protein
MRQARIALRTILDHAVRDLRDSNLPAYYSFFAATFDWRLRDYLLDTKLDSG